MDREPHNRRQYFMNLEMLWTMASFPIFMRIFLYSLLLRAGLYLLRKYVSIFSSGTGTMSNHRSKYRRFVTRSFQHLTRGFYATGKLFVEVENFLFAADMYKCSGECAASLKDIDPKSWTAQWQTRLANIYHRCAEALERIGEVEESKQYFQKARYCLEHNIIQEQNSDKFVDCAVLDEQLVSANRLVSENELTKAKREFRKVRFRLERKSNNLSRDESRGLFFAFCGIGECELKTKRYKQAIHWYNRAIDVYANSTYRLDLDRLQVVEPLRKLAYALAKSGRIKEGLEVSDWAMEMLLDVGVDNVERVRALTNFLVWRIEIWAQWGWGSGEDDMERLATVWSDYDDMKENIRRIDKRLAMTRFRLESFEKISELFSNYCMRVIIKGCWVRTVSAQLACELNEVGRLTSKSRRSELMNELRKLYMLFHQRWFTFCLDRDLDSVVRVIAAVQGRQLSEQISDEWRDDWFERPEVLEYRMRRMQERAGLYELDYDELVLESHPYPQVTLETLRNGLCGDEEVVVILVDQFRMGVERYGAYIVRKSANSIWIPLGALRAIVDRVEEFEQQLGLPCPHK